MKISLRVQPNSKKEGLVRTEDGTWKLKVSSPAIEGRANERVIELLSEILKIPKRDIAILKGETSKLKTIEVPDYLDLSKIFESNAL